MQHWNAWAAVVWVWVIWFYNSHIWKNERWANQFQIYFLLTLKNLCLETFVIQKIQSQSCDVIYIVIFINQKSTLICLSISGLGDTVLSLTYLDWKVGTPASNLSMLDTEQSVPGNPCGWSDLISILWFDIISIMQHWNAWAAVVWVIQSYHLLILIEKWKHQPDFSPLEAEKSVQNDPCGSEDNLNHKMWFIISIMHNA